MRANIDEALNEELNQFEWAFHYLCKRCSKYQQSYATNEQKIAPFGTRSCLPFSIVGCQIKI
jgi:hypothetical protein